MWPVCCSKEQARCMSPEDLGNKSLRRNPLIADLLHRIAFIEKAGTGIRRMRDGARELGYPEPTFAADNFFTALFRPIPLTDEKDTPQVLAILQASASV